MSLFLFLPLYEEERKPSEVKIDSYLFLSRYFLWKLRIQFKPDEVRKGEFFRVSCFISERR